MKNRKMNLTDRKAIQLLWQVAIVAESTGQASLDSVAKGDLGRAVLAASKAVDTLQDFLFRAKVRLRRA